MRITKHSLMGMVVAGGLLSPSWLWAETPASVLRQNYQPRVYLPVALIFPQKGHFRLSASSLIDGVDRALRERTGLRPIFVDVEDTDECQQDPAIFTCLTKRLRALSSRVQGQGQEGAPMALILSVRATEETPTIRVAVLRTLLDVIAARQFRDRTSVEQQVQQSLVFGDSLEWKDPRQKSDADRQLIQRLDELAVKIGGGFGQLMKTLLQPRYTLAVRVPNTGGVVSLGSLELRVPALIDEVQIQNIHRPKIEVRMHFRGFEPVVQAVDLPSLTSESPLKLTWSPVIDPTGRHIVMVTGAVGALAGVVVTGVGAAQAPSANVCIAPQDEPCPQGFSGGQLVPVGVGLIALGGTWALGPFVEEGTGMPWWSVAIGAVGMVAISGTLALLNRNDL